MRNRGFEILPEYQEVAKEIEQTVEEVTEYLPQRATRKSSGYDLRAIEDCVLNPGEIKLIGTGLTAYMQDDEELQLRGRSGLSLKGLSLANGIGTVDSDYYGQHIKFIYANKGSEPITIHKGDRIGQGVFAHYLTIDDDRPVKEERTGGFGSSGKA